MSDTDNRQIDVEALDQDRAEATRAMADDVIARLDDERADEVDRILVTLARQLADIERETTTDTDTSGIRWR